MTIDRLNEEILQLINSYSNNGSLTTGTENADYLLRTRNLIDICQKELACIRKIEANTNVPLTGLTTKGNYSEISLPDDFKELKSVYLTDSNGNYYPISGYLKEKDKILVDSSLEGTLTINYYKKPTTITSTTDVNTELEIDEDAQQLVPFYVSGWVFMDLNPTIGAMLVNEYKEKKQELRSLNPAVPIDIIDVQDVVDIN